LGKSSHTPYIVLSRVDATWCRLLSRKKKEETVVSTEHRERAPSVGGSGAPPDILDAFFQEVAASGHQPRLRRVTGVCEFDVDGAGTWYVAVKRGALTVSKGEEPAGWSPPNCVVSLTAEDFLRILRHENNLNIYAAVLQELVTISGDTVFAWNALGSFEPEAGVGRRREELLGKSTS
jgi:hypothetical protein